MPPRFRLATPATAVVLGGVILALTAVTFPLAALAGIKASAGSGSLIFARSSGCWVSWWRGGNRATGSAGCSWAPWASWSSAVRQARTR